MLIVSQNVVLFDNQTQKKIHHWKSDQFDFQVNRLALSANNKVLGTAGDNSVIIWDTNTGKTVARWPAKGFDEDSKISAFYIGQSGEMALWPNGD
jgi:WD40 repeat protein